MKTKMNILLLSVSFCFAAMKSTDVFASLDSTSDDPISLFNSSVPNIDIAQAYDNCSLKGTLTDIAKRSARDKKALASVRLSDKATLRAQRGLGGDYLGFAQQRDYREFYMLGDGNCGRYSAGTNHADSNALLLANSGNARVRQMAHHEIYDIFHSNEINRLPSQLVDTPRYRQLAEDLSTQEILLLTGAGNRGDIIAEKERLVAEWAQEEQTFIDYVTYGLTDGNFMDYRQDLVEQNPFGHNVVTTRPYFLDTILYLQNKNLRVWQEIQWGIPVENRPIDAAGHTMQLFHDQVHNPAWETVDLIHRGNHYNRVVPIDNAAALDQALADEERHLETYAYMTINTTMSTRYEKILDAVMGDMIAKPHAPQTMKVQAQAYRAAFQADKILQKAASNITINKSDKDITQIILARAYALKSKELEQKQNRTDEETAKMLDYKAKADALKRQVPQNVTQDMIDIEAMQIYQFARAHKDIFEDAGIAATANPAAALAYEIDEIAAALYKNTDKFLRTKKDDDRYVYLKKFQRAQKDYKDAVRKYNGINLGEHGSYAWESAHSAAIRKMDSIAAKKKQDRQAYLNPELIQKDPYLSVWNVSIDQDPNYSTNLTSNELTTIKDDVFTHLDKTSWEKADIRTTKSDMNNIWSKISSGTAQAELLKRRVKRVFDTFLSRGEGKTAEEKKLDGYAKFAMAITANPHGCITGQEEVVKKIEDGLFGATEALTAGAKISKIIIKDRQHFIYDHGKSFTMAQAQEPHLNIPVLLNKRLSVAFSLGVPVAPMYAIGCGKPDDAALQPQEVVERYFGGGSLKVESYYHNASTRVDFEARTPEYIANKLLQAWHRAHKKSTFREDFYAGRDEIQRLRKNGTIQEKARYEEANILDQAHRSGRTKDVIEQEKIIVFGKDAYAEQVKRALKNTLKPLHQDNWKDYFDENKERLIQEYSQTQGGPFGLDAQAYQDQQIQLLGRADFQRKSNEEAGEPLYKQLVKNASEANLRLAHGDDWEEEWDNQEDDLIEHFSQAQGGLVFLDADAYKDQEIQRLGAEHIRRSGVNKFKDDAWKDVVLMEVYEQKGRSMKADHDSEIELHGEISRADIEAFIDSDPVLKAEYESEDLTIMFDDTKHFEAGGGRDAFKPEFFMYMLKKFGYVIDPNEPIDGYLGASDEENKSYIEKVDEARNAEFAKMMNISAAKAREVSTVRREIESLKTLPNSLENARKIERLEQELDPSRRPALQPAPYVPQVQQPAPYVPQVQQTGPSLNVSEITSSAFGIEQQIEMLEALPSSRAKNAAVRSLKQRLGNPGSVLPTVSSPQAPIYSVSRPVSVPHVPSVPAPSISASNISAPMSVQDIEAEIARISALPSSRLNNSRLYSLQQSLLNVGAAGLPSMHVPSVPSSINSSVLGVSQLVRPAVIPNVYVPAPSSASPAAPVLTRAQIEQEIAHLESQPSSRITNAKLSKLRTQLATL